MAIQTYAFDAQLQAWHGTKDNAAIEIFWGEKPMASAPEIQVSRLLDEPGLGPYQIRLMAWAVSLSLIDGYDIGAIAFAAPHLVASWGIERSALGPVLSANNIGVLFGSAIFGWIGDRYGRKTALISANLVFGVLTFAAAYSHDLTQLFWLRLFAGIAAKLPPATAALAAAILQLGGTSARCLCAGGCSGTAFSPSHSYSCSQSPLSARSALPD